MIHITGIANLQLRRNPLRPEHCRHQRRIIKTDSFPGIQCLIRIRCVPIRNILRFLFIIGNIFNYKIINLRYHIQIRIAVLSCKTLTLFYTLGICREIYIIIRMQKRGKFICDLYVQILGKAYRIQIVLYRHTLQKCYLIRTIPARKRINRIITNNRNRIGILCAIRGCHLELDFFITSIITDHHIAICRMGCIQYNQVISICHFTGSLRLKHLRRRISRIPLFPGLAFFSLQCTSARYQYTCQK